MYSKYAFSPCRIALNARVDARLRQARADRDRVAVHADRVVAGRARSTCRRPSVGPPVAPSCRRRRGGRRRCGCRRTRRRRAQRRRASATTRAGPSSARRTIGHGDDPFIESAVERSRRCRCGLAAPEPARVPLQSRASAADDAVGQHVHEQDQQDAEDRGRAAGFATHSSDRARSTTRASGTSSQIQRAARTRRATPPTSGPTTVAVPPITTATRNSIESWKVWTLSALAVRERRAPSTIPRPRRTARSSANASTFTGRDVDADRLGRGLVVAHRDQRRARSGCARSARRARRSRRPRTPSVT